MEGFSWKVDIPMNRRLARIENRDHAAHQAYRRMMAYRVWRSLHFKTCSTFDRSCLEPKEKDYALLGPASVYANISVTEIMDCRFFPVVQ